jgi:hypothetical protein
MQLNPLGFRRFSKGWFFPLSSRMIAYLKDTKLSKKGDLAQIDGYPIWQNGFTSLSMYHKKSVVFINSKMLKLFNVNNNHGCRFWSMSTLGCSRQRKDLICIGSRCLGSNWKWRSPWIGIKILLCFKSF